MTSQKLLQKSVIVSKMATNKLGLTTVELFKYYRFFNKYPMFLRLRYCTTDSKNEESSTEKKSGFAKFFQKQEDFLQPTVEKPDLKNETFVSLLRNSKFIDLGDPVGKLVIGQIYHIMEDDLYIDFGWKFPTICKRPEKNKELYVKGAKVRLRIENLELATTFLGSDKEITLLEADCVLLGLAKK